MPSLLLNRDASTPKNNINLSKVIRFGTVLYFILDISKIPQKSSWYTYQVKSILLTGGTGFVGGQFLEKYQQRFRFFSIYRHHYSRSFPNVTWVKADLENSSAVEELSYSLPPGIDYLVHIGGASPNRAYADGSFNATTIGTDNLILLAKKLKIKKIIYISSLSVLNRFKGPYVKSKLSAEYSILKSGLKYTILRPTTILGSEAHDFLRIIKFVRICPFFIVIDNGISMVQPIFVDDLTNIISSCIANSPTDNKTYEITGSDCLSQKEFVKKIVSRFHQHFLILPVPANILIFISRVVELINPKVGLNEERIQLQKQSVCYDSKFLESEFKINFHPLDQILDQICLKSPSR